MNDKQKTEIWDRVKQGIKVIPIDKQGKDDDFTRYNIELKVKMPVILNNSTQLIDYSRLWCISKAKFQQYLSDNACIDDQIHMAIANVRDKFLQDLEAQLVNTEIKNRSHFTRGGLKISDPADNFIIIATEEKETRMSYKIDMERLDEILPNINIWGGFAGRLGITIDPELNDSLNAGYDSKGNAYFSNPTKNISPIILKGEEATDFLKEKLKTGDRAIKDLPRTLTPEGEKQRLLDQINNAPEPLKDYIHNFVNAHGNVAHILMQNTVWEDENKQLRAKKIGRAHV